MSIVLALCAALAAFGAIEFERVRQAERQIAEINSQYDAGHILLSGYCEKTLPVYLSTHSWLDADAARRFEEWYVNDLKNKMWLESNSLEFHTDFCGLHEAEMIMDIVKAKQQTPLNMRKY